MRWFPIFLLFFSLQSGCYYLNQTSQNVGIVLTRIKSPVIVDVSYVNAPLTPAELKEVHQYLASQDKKADSLDEKESFLDQSTRLMQDYVLNAPGNLLRFSKWYRLFQEEQKQNEQIDTFHDMLTRGENETKNTLVMVCISGGGSRAASLGAQTLALLEKRYNHKLKSYPNKLPFKDCLQVFSSVSGGSVFASCAALYYQFSHDQLVAANNNQQQVGLDKQLHQQQYQFYQKLNRKLGSGIYSPYILGSSSGVRYLSPQNFLLLLLTNDKYLNHMARSLDITYQSLMQRSFFKNLFKNLSQEIFTDSGQVKLGYLRNTPRFYFNATCLENGMPFILSNKIVHPPKKDPVFETSRLDLAIRKPNNEQPSHNENSSSISRPFKHALTLESIYSSPANFPLSSAAMASAAFPFAFEPLQLRKYSYNPSLNKIYPTQDILHLTDGGIFDNSGLTTAIDLAEYLSEKKKGKRLILISINAEISEYDRLVASRISEEASLTWFPFAIGSPIRGILSGFESLGTIHFRNKRRSEEIAVRRLEALKQQGNLKEYYYFPIDLTQLSESDRYPIPRGRRMFEAVQRVPTSFVISSSHQTLLAEAANFIMSARQSFGWKVGPTIQDGKPEEIKEVGEALVYALLRAQQENWEQPIK